MPSRRGLCVALASALGGAVLAGCGGGTADTTTVDSGGTGTNATGTSTGPVALKFSTAGLSGYVHTDGTSPVVTNMSVVAGTANSADYAPYQFRFDGDGFLRFIIDTRTGTSGTLLVLPDRVELHCHDRTDAFLGGRVFYQEGEQYVVADLPTPDYAGLDTLPGRTDVTAALEETLLPFQSLFPTTVGSSLGRALFALMPFPVAHASTLASTFVSAAAWAREVSASVVVPVLTTVLAVVMTKSTTGGGLANLAKAAATGAQAMASPAFVRAIDATGSPEPTPTYPAIVLDPFSSAISGTYSGTFAGDDSGTFEITIGYGGKVTGTGSSADSGAFSISGRCDSKGNLTATFGSTSLGSTFRGRGIFDARGVKMKSIQGTWLNEEWGESGTFEGRRDEGIIRPYNWNLSIASGVRG